jgi:hypothetical protein
MHFVGAVVSGVVCTVYEEVFMCDHIILQRHLRFRGWLSEYGDNVMGWKTKKSGFDSRCAQDIFLISINFITPLCPTQAPKNRDYFPWR